MIFNNNNKYSITLITVLLVNSISLLLLLSSTTTLAKEQQLKQPLLASIQYIANTEQQETTGQHFCYGSIIHNKFILTAAHCNIQIPLEHLEIVITMNNNNKIMKRKVKQFISHELYNSQFIKNDIALIELNEELPLSIFNNNNYNNDNNNFIMKLESMINIPFDVSLFTTTTSSSSNSGSEIIIVPNEECNVIDLEMSSPQQLCAKLNLNNKQDNNNNKIENDLMMGESGSPIYYMEEKSGQLVQVGITSYGSNNNYLNNNNKNKNSVSVLGVYTNVANYLNWIKKHINNNNSQQVLMIKEYNFNLERNVRPEPIPLLLETVNNNNLKLRGKLDYNNNVIIIERMVNKKKIIKFEKNINNNDDNNNMNKINKIATNNAMKGSVSSSSMWWMVVITLISTIIAVVI